MSPLGMVAVALAGGAGAAARFVLDGAVRGRTRSSFPWGTALINVSGSFLLGLLGGLLARHAVSPGAYAVAGTGFLGGFTTFSTASVEAVRLVQRRRWGAAAGSVLGVAALAVVAAAAGMLLASRA